jgi:aerobic-type carbon monoxide dehydrogenase small subunit (CoxS/CutS family)
MVMARGAHRLAVDPAQSTDADIDQIDNICRCRTCVRIRAAIKRAAATI